MADKDSDQGGMKKYGVEFGDKVKVADGLGMGKAPPTKCPVCGQTLDSRVPPHCPIHGTEPFEKK